MRDCGCLREPRLSGFWSRGNPPRDAPWGPMIFDQSDRLDLSFTFKFHASCPSYLPGIPFAGCHYYLFERKSLQFIEYFS